VVKVDAVSLAKRFKEDQGYWPNIENPRTLQEKILWRKLHEDMSDAVRLADKVAVRDYVREVAGPQYLVEALAIADHAEDLDFDSLPSSFILKVNHSSGTNLVVEDRSELQVESVRRILNSLLRRTYGRRLGEFWYSRIPPKILAERLLVDQEYGRPVEYRFHVFHGRAEFIQVVTSRETSSQLGRDTGRLEGLAYIQHGTAQHNLYGLDWQPAPFQFRGAAVPTPSLARIPPAREELLAVAEKLAGDWGYVRVDMYCLNGTDVFFGEMTFAHNSGLLGFIPESYNEHFGSLWDVRRRYVREP
jgi:hypothetical protein